eukprot:TRINITY_DN17183_c0_g1_i1.p2 TRINITY_DN17183_c0_g1~~TRINITY_DN17183_c0_g1_i1.p2  ORF type:complete len:61 (+),score=9.07 TRINITY_DN17183_c0_g1_i1:238-420(+)
MPEIQEGYAWNTNDIGVVQAFGGPGMLIMQILLFPMLAKKFSVLQKRFGRSSETAKAHRG